MTTLDEQVDTSLQEILRRRKTKTILVVLGLVAGIGSMLAVTALMYSGTSGNGDEDRIGAESFR